jgi:ribose transport system permease protein
MWNNTGHFFRKQLGKVDIQIYVLIGMTLALYITMSLTVRHFSDLANLRIMISNFILEGIMALGMTLVIISGGIDLSIAGIMPFSAIIFALMMVRGVPAIPAALVVLAVSGVFGFINNYLRKLLNVHSFVVTMAMMLTLRGINLVITGGKVVSSLPRLFVDFSRSTPLGLKPALWIFFGFVVFYCLMMTKNRYFRQVYFVGGNPLAAQLSGINTESFLRFVYIQSAVLAGVAGILACMTYNSANASFGINVEVRVITAVAIGGTSMVRGGIGTIGGTLLGILFVAIIFGAFIMSGISTYYQDVVTGTLLIFAVVFSERLKSLHLGGKL